ncbi:hypothetical protein HMPREF0091_10529 [Fannyhessea vaginae DSM 15829]|uniref:Uncharacterized protein n=1 Tax=Fannyhessea vaginae DSM 15829 TaxID=525256 RepID=F1T4D8_9ACTN|nr:hypothetical protein HMPREF0091_10529 [Fannyhessea vaginae DSM 15829]
MIPKEPATIASPDGFSRIRGGDPTAPQDNLQHNAFFPHTRG